MYEELVDEFEFKKSASNILEVKDQKILTLTLEVQKLKSSMVSNDQLLISFKRELGNIASSMTVGKELEESVRMLYKKYVRGEKVVTHNSKVGSEGALKRASGLIFFYFSSPLVFLFLIIFSFFVFNFYFDVLCNGYPISFVMDDCYYYKNNNDYKYDDYDNNNDSDNNNNNYNNSNDNHNNYANNDIYENVLFLPHRAYYGSR